MRGVGFLFRQSARNMPTGVAHDPRDSVFEVHPFEVCLGKTGRDSVQETLQIAERPRVATDPVFLMIEVEPGDQRSHRGQYRS